MRRGDTMAGGGQWRAAGAGYGTNNSPGGRNGPSAAQGGGLACCVCRLPARRDGPATTSVCSRSHPRQQRPTIPSSSRRSSLLCSATCPASQSTPSALFDITAQRHAFASRPQSSVSSHTRLWGAHCCLCQPRRSLARWTCKAKLAGPRSKHTTYPLIPTQHTFGAPPPRPLSTFLLVHAVAGPLPRPLNYLAVAFQRFVSPASPSRRRLCTPLSSVYTLPASQLSRASTVARSSSFVLALHTGRLSWAVCLHFFRRALLQAPSNSADPPQTVISQQNQASAITHNTYTRAPGYLFSLD